MKRRAVLGAAVVVVLLVAGTAVLSARGAPEVPDKPTITMQVWGSSIGHYTNAGIVFDLYPELAERMELRVDVAGDHDADSADAFRRRLAAGRDIPDIMYFNYTQIPEFAEAGVLHDIRDAVRPYEDQLVPTAMDLVMYEDQYIAFPYELKSKIWYYRKDIFDEAGVNPDEVRTLEDFIAAGERIQELYPDKYIHNQGTDMIHYDLLMMLPVFNARYVDDDGRYIVDRDPGVRETFRFFKELKDSDVVLGVMDWSPDWEAAFADGTLVSQLNASWFGLDVFLPTYAEGQEGLWAATTWPEAIAVGSDAGGSVYTIPAGAENKELAMEFLQRMRFAVDANVRISEERGVFPIIAEAQRQRLETSAGDRFFADDSFLTALERSFEYFAVFPFTPAASAEMPLVLAQLNRYIHGELSLDEALQATQRDLETQIGDPYEW